MTVSFNEHPHLLQEFLSSIDTFLFDCDGVLWHEDHRFLPGVKETLSYLHNDLGKKLIFVSNNSTKNRQDMAALFHKLDATFIQADSIFGSSFATAVYLETIENIPKSKKIFIIGQNGLSSELELAGYSVIHASEHELRSMEEDVRKEIPAPEEVGAVVVGFDYHFNYHKMAHANYYLRHVDKLTGKMIPFVATNTDAAYMTKNGPYPGTGSIVMAVSTACQRAPIIVGKPESVFMDCIKRAFNIDPERTCMIGDRLDTDMLFGVRGGLQTCLVLTGIASAKDVSETKEEEKPDYLLSSLGDIATILNIV